MNWLPTHLPLEALSAFATSLALGFLLGLERERSPAALAGVRTFALTAVLGTLSALLAERLASPWLVVAAWLAVAAAIINAYRVRGRAQADPGTTTEVALLLCFGLGVLCWLGERTLAVMLAIASVVLLHFKTELAGFARRFSAEEVRSILQFCVLSLVILPILPDRQYGPYAAFNPYRTWLMVVLISGVGLAGYLLLRSLGSQLGARIAGVLGGLVSSTATTMLHAREARAQGGAATFRATVVVLANLTVLARLALVGAIAAPSLARDLAVLMGGGLLAGLLAAWPLLRSGDEQVVLPSGRNPTELRQALGFAALYSVVLLAAAWLTDIAGRGGLYLVALASGLTDVDAITLSSLQMYAQQTLSAQLALTAIVLALLANTAFKLTLAFSLGGAAFGRRVLPPMLASVLVALALLGLLYLR